MPGDGSTKGSRVALAAATGALLVSVAAVLMAGVALSRSGEHVAGTPSPSPSPTDVPSPVPTASTDPPAPPPDTVDPGNIAPNADFELAYAKKALRAQPPCGGGVRWVDLDEPRVGAEENKGEFRVENQYCRGSTQIDLLDDLPVATVTSPDASAKDCAEALASAPTNEPLVPTAGVNYCVQTSRATAEGQGIEQKIVLVTVSSIAKDGTLNLLVTAWSVPV